MAAALRTTVLFALIASAAASTAASAEAAGHAANPIRKVVMMLQNMQAQVTAEGKHEEELYEKFMCYCTTGKGDLEKSIAAAEAHITAVTASSKADLETKAALDAAIK